MITNKMKRLKINKSIIKQGLYQFINIKIITINK